jgi:hypothetical protein
VYAYGLVKFNTGQGERLIEANYALASCRHTSNPRYHAAAWSLDPHVLACPICLLRLARMVYTFRWWTGVRTSCGL